MKNTDYIYCEDCEVYVDFYHYDHNIEDAGHKGCKWRYITDEERKGCEQDCKDWKCEDFVMSDAKRRED